MLILLTITHWNRLESKEKPRQRRTLSYGSRSAKLSPKIFWNSLIFSTSGSINTLPSLFASWTSVKSASRSPSKDFSWYVSSSALLTPLKEHLKIAIYCKSHKLKRRKRKEKKQNHLSKNSWLNNLPEKKGLKNMLYWVLYAIHLDP